MVISLWIRLRDPVLTKLLVHVDYAGPIKYKKGWKVESKAYIALYACSMSCALYLDLVSSLEIQEFLLSLEKYIARKGRPYRIYSDNGSTFIDSTGWLRKTMSDKLSQFFAQNKIL